MTDKNIDLVRKAIDAKNIRRDVLAGYGVDRQTKRTINDRVFESYAAHSRYWLTSTPVNATRNDRDTDIILYRNAPIATTIQEHKVGDEFHMRIPGKGNYVGSYFHHDLHLLSRIDLDNNYIEFPGDVKYMFDSLEKYLKYLTSVVRELEEKENRKRELEEEKKRAQDEQARKALEEELRKIEEERREIQQYKEKINNLTRYIHTQVQLRFRPIVDPIQTRIKTSHAYDGTAVIIDGGPGTGKTTTMISRLKYLIDLDAIDQDAELEQDKRRFHLSSTQIRALWELNKKDLDWVFFSPSSLLSKYLAHAMENEGLIRPTSKVFYWADRLDSLMKDYGFFDPSSDKAAFVNAKSAQQAKQLIANTGLAIVQWEDYFVSRYKNLRSKLPTLKELQADWKTLALYIRNQLEGVENKSIDELIVLLVQLSRLADECKPYLDERKTRLDDITNRITAKIRRDEDVRQALLEIILKNEQEGEQEDSEDPEIDNDDENEEVLDTYDETEKILRQVRRWVEPYARSVFNKEKLSETNETIAQIIVPLLSESEQTSLERIASLYVFNKYAVLTRGADKILFASFATKYKNFRKYIIKEKLEGWNIKLVEELVEARKNTRLHKQEQSLLIGFINHLAVKIIRKNPSAQHTYIKCYNLYCRPIIGIDEVTDFSDVDIYAMCSFAHKDFSSITLAGDLMQRLTNVGLHSWDELKAVLPKSEVMPLQTSYRQSIKMLDVARRLYVDTIDEQPTYTANMQEKEVPEAIAYISDSLEEKIEWIEQRIREVYVAYGKTMPSIAIFLNDEQRVANFAQLLKETDFFYDNGIKVIDGSQGETLGSSKDVRVFPIDKVKGMEFDVVFFVDIDDTPWTEDIVKRYLYVGVSRAAFFLGVTLKEDNPELTKYFNVGATWRGVMQ